MLTVGVTIQQSVVLEVAWTSLFHHTKNAAGKLVQLYRSLDIGDFDTALQLQAFVLPRGGAFNSQGLGWVQLLACNRQWMIKLCKQWDEPERKTPPSIKIGVWNSVIGVLCQGFDAFRYSRTRIIWFQLLRALKTVDIWKSSGHSWTLQIVFFFGRSESADCFTVTVHSAQRNSHELVFFYFPQFMHRVTLDDQIPTSCPLWF